MQNSQEINWLAILAPSLIVGLSAIIVQILLTFWLSRRTADYQKEISEKIEDYKKDISKELENYKFQLQSDFQTRFYEFQTRYSLLHQKRVEAIENLFALLAIVQNDMQILTNWEGAARIETIKEFYIKTEKDLVDLCNYFETKRIYFDDEVNIKVINIVRFTDFLKSGFRHDESFRNSHPEITASLETQARNLIDQNIRPVMKQLENYFKKLLSAENPNNQLEKKQ